MLHQLLLRRLKVNILDEDTSIVWVILNLGLSASHGRVINACLLLGNLLVDEVLIYTSSKFWLKFDTRLWHAKTLTLLELCLQVLQLLLVPCQL